jgi:hypothetical protein
VAEAHDLAKPLMKLVKSEGWRLLPGATIAQKNEGGADEKKTKP